MSTELVALSNALAQATERVAANAVAVHTESRGSSSGIVWRNGVIVTAEHALRRDEDIQLTLPDGRVVPATLAGRDASTDLAVLKSSEAASAVTEFGDIAALKPGALVLVVGRTRASGPVAGLGTVSLVVSERRTWTGSSLSLCPPGRRSSADGHWRRGRRCARPGCWRRYTALCALWGHCPSLR